jgi:hypothetical protein
MQYASFVLGDIDECVIAANLPTIGLGDGQPASRGLVLPFMQETIGEKSSRNQSSMKRHDEKLSLITFSSCYQLS